MSCPTITDLFCGAGGFSLGSPSRLAGQGVLTMTFVQWQPTDPFIGPPKPLACVDGWKSHTWVLDIECGSIGLSTKACRLCNDGVHDLENEYLNGSFPVSLKFFKDTYYNGEVDVWWQIEPVISPEEE